MKCNEILVGSMTPTGKSSLNIYCETTTNKIFINNVIYPKIFTNKTILYLLFNPIVRN
jgi:hypothetical protein